jgi:hypothetical protein
MNSIGWKRDTQWRQGSAIPQGASLSIGLIRPENADSHIAVVISHDCDLVEEDLVREPFVEVIIGKVIESVSPNHTNAKSPNKLHLDFLAEGRPLHLELVATEKCQVRKTSLASEYPDSQISLSFKSREILQTWLSLRYRRAAFPDTLNGHLSGLREVLQKIGKKSPEAIIGFYVYYEPDREILDSSEPYEVWIVVVFDHTIIEAEEIAQQASKKITEKLESKFKGPAGWHDIDLRSCEYSSSEQFSLHNAMTFKSFPLDHISLRSLVEKAETDGA